MLQFRTEIRQGLQAMVAPSGDVLHAVYGSLSEDLVDAENVLFYNVGTSHFTHLANDGIRFERAYEQPPQIPKAVDYIPKHYHRYMTTGRQDEFTHWHRGQTLATWADSNCGPITSSLKVPAVWLGIKLAAHTLSDPSHTPPKQFGVSVHLRYGAKQTNIHPATVVKPLLDGIIAAFHQHAWGSKYDAEVLKRLTAVTGRSVSELIKILAAPGVLGPRLLVYCHGMGLQWNPKDEDCMAAEILLVQDTGGDGVQVSGELFEVVARNA
jgi:hypothetical protein